MTEFLLEDIGSMINENLKEIDASGIDFKESYETSSYLIKNKMNKFKRANLTK